MCIFYLLLLFIGIKIDPSVKYDLESLLIFFSDIYVQLAQIIFWQFAISYKTTNAYLSLKIFRIRHSAALYRYQPFKFYNM